MNNKIIAFILLSLAFIVGGCQQQPEMTLKVLQFNIWQEGTQVPGGFDAIIDEIIASDADLICLSEVRNYHNNPLDERMVAALAQRGYTYYAQRSEDSGLISRWPIIKQSISFPLKNDRGSITKALIDVQGVTVALYSGHLDYRNCALYLPRGYCGSTWKKLDGPVTDIDIIAADNLASQRDEAIMAFIADAQKDIAQGYLVIFGVDMNEPSHLDWTGATKDLFDRNGVVMAWHNTLALEKAGFIDAYRAIYPDPLTHPGFTFPSDNPLVDIKKLAWAPTVDDRDRIDYIFYHPDQRLQLQDIVIVGPRGSIVRNQRVLETSEDLFIAPAGIWPTDHKAILATFKLKIAAKKP